MPKNLSAWLSEIEHLHPKAIAMGLERVQRMIARLQLTPKFTIITVAGTNGKGSTCAMLAEIYRQAGYQVGSYSSPHLLRYNERVRVNGVEATDDALCAAFEVVDAARNSRNEAIPLTYFEVGTLAAMWHFMQTNLDVVILEIGLGGRLDAVNAFEPDCAIVTSVDLDHQEFLGETREKIGFEKAGVYRTKLPAICGDAKPPESLVNHARDIQADFKCISKAFGYTLTNKLDWQYSVQGKVRYTLPRPALLGDYQLSNAACAVTAVETLQKCLPVPEIAIAKAMQNVKLAGRFQTAKNHPRVILDVAHNPHAALALASNLAALQQANSKTFAVFAMLADKDMLGVIEAVKAEIDVWYVAGIDHIRGASASELALNIAKIVPQARIYTFDNAVMAYKQATVDIEACKDEHDNDKIVVFGSFFTVSSVMEVLASDSLSSIHL